MRTFCHILSLFAVLSLASACASKKKAEINESDQPKAEASKAEEAVVSKEEDNSYQCEVLNDTRLVTLDKSENRCEVHYTKFGDKSQVAWAEATPSICSDVFSKIRENIESRGFKCVSASNVKQETKTASSDVKPEAKTSSSDVKQEAKASKQETKTASKE